ncbi:MAG: helix-turn-helix domain-containing protein [Xanthomonadales bacterium]|nr:helix-turn-helix domain-containing protein [Xanthomonadales bacterium]
MYQTYAPAPELSPYIECYWRWQSGDENPQTEFIVPDAAPELIVHLGKPPSARSGSGTWQRQPSEFLYCAAEHCLELRFDQPMDVFGVRFRPWGLSLFSQQPMSAMLDRAVSPTEALDGLAQPLVNAVRNAGADERQLEKLNRLLSQLPPTRKDRAAEIAMLIDSLDAGEKPVQLLAEGLAKSSRTVRRVWRQLVGISPRAYQKLMRVHRALAQIEDGQPMAAVAADCGFADQAHMARQIKEISGLTPSRLKTWLGQETYRDLYASRRKAPWIERS